MTVARFMVAAACERAATREHCQNYVVSLYMYAAAIGLSGSTALTSRLRQLRAEYADYCCLSWTEHTLLTCPKKAAHSLITYPGHTLTVEVGWVKLGRAWRMVTELVARQQQQERRESPVGRMVHSFASTVDIFRVPALTSRQGFGGFSCYLRGNEPMTELS